MFHKHRRLSFADRLTTKRDTVFVDLDEVQVLITAKTTASILD
jgi:hypothetical protein